MGTIQSWLMVIDYLIPRLSLLCALLWIIWILWEFYHTEQKDSTIRHPIPNGNMGLPFFGHTVEFLRKPKAFINDKVQRYGSIFRLHLFGKPAVMVIGVQAIKSLLHREHSIVSPERHCVIKELLGAGALTLMVDPQHKTRKKVILSAFTHSKLSSYMARLQEIIQRHIDKWLATGHILAYTEGKKLMFDATCDILVGFQNQSEDERAELLEAFKEFRKGFFSLHVNLPGFQFHKSMKAKRLMKRKVADCIQALVSSGDLEHAPSVLSTLVAAMDGREAPAHNQLLVDSAIELMFAGHDTTSSALFAVMMFLAQSPRVVDRLREEIREFGLDGGASLTFQTTHRMPYLNAVVLETLAQLPPVPSNFRVAHKTFELMGCQIPAGWRILCLLRESHNLYMDQEFTPERWLTDEEELPSQTSQNPERKDTTGGHDRIKHPNPSKPSPKDMLHFGSGSRSCVGKEFAKMFLRAFIVLYVESCDAHASSPEPVELSHFPFLAPVQDLSLALSTRVRK